MTTKTTKLKDLRAATEASVAAVLGKKQIGPPGIIVGLWLDKERVQELGLTPKGIAGDIAKQVSIASGIKVKPGVQPAGGGILVGFIQPKVSK